MYAIIESGGKQYKVSLGGELLLEKIEGNPGDKVELGKVLFFNKNGEKLVFGKDLARIKVKGTILEQMKGDKITVFKYKPKKNYRRKKGHRQLLTKVRIDEIIGVQQEKKASPAPSRPPAKRAPESQAKKAKNAG